MTVEQFSLLDLERPPITTITGGSEPDPADYDITVVNLSGKDGHAALDRAVQTVRAAGVPHRLFTMHADLGLMEWPGVHHKGRYHPGNAEHVAATADFYGVPPERRISTRRVVTEPAGLRRPQSLLEQIAQMEMWPDHNNRYCSSDQKTTKIRAALTPVVDLLHYRLKRQVRILTVLGLRAQESRDRAKVPVYSVRESLSNRHEDVWLPVHDVKTDEIRAITDATPVGHHWTYDSEPGAGDWQGCSRVSCSMCVLANKRDLILATRRRPRLAALYLEVEEHIGHRFRNDMSMRQIITWAEQSGGPEPGVVLRDDGPEFRALEREVRRRLAEGTRLPAGTAFTPVPMAVCLSCVGC